jgi:hypothetical protein
MYEALFIKEVTANGKHIRAKKCGNKRKSP